MADIRYIPPRVTALPGGGAVGSVESPSSSTNHALARFNGTDGVNIEDGAVIEDDAGHLTGVADPVENDGAATKAYVDGQVASAAPAAVAQTSFLVSGGQVAWVSDLTFLVSAAVYYILGVLYKSAQQSVTLGAADGTNPRLDVIALDNTGTVVVVPGTAAAQPSEPDVDPGTQLKLAMVQVPANATQPSVTTKILYAEHAGAPTELNWTTSGSGFNVNSANAAHTGTKCIEGTAVAARAYAQGQTGTGTIDLSQYRQPRALRQVEGYLDRGPPPAPVLAPQRSREGHGGHGGVGVWGFDSSITTSWQVLAIPLIQFMVPDGTLVNQLRITDTGGSLGLYLDDVSLQSGAVSNSGTSGLTQAQADARYAALVHGARHVPSGADPVPGIVIGPTGAPTDNHLAVFDGTSGQLLKDGGAVPAGPSASTVLGPASASDSHLAVFDGTTGKLVKDGGAVPSGPSASTVLGPSSVVDADIAVFDGTTGKLIKDGGVTLLQAFGAAGDVHGPASSTDNALPRFDGTGGKTLQGSGVTVDDGNGLSVPGQIVSPLVSDGSSGSAKTIDWTTGLNHYLVLTDNVALTFTAPGSGGRLVLLLNTGAGCSRRRGPPRCAGPETLRRP